jgi:hypothetical protein
MVVVLFTFLGLRTGSGALLSDEETEMTLSKEGELVIASSEVRFEELQA